MNPDTVTCETCKRAPASWWARWRGSAAGGRRWPVCGRCKRQAEAHAAALEHEAMAPPEAEDAWSDTGYQAHDTGPADPPTLPVCPFCATAGGHDVNTSATGGLVCRECGAQFTGQPGEREANTTQASLWEEATRKGDAA